MTVITKTSKDGGGCGCGSGGCSGNCGGACGSGGSALCPQGAIARPRFFAGQLLTQEDLQLIVDYAVGKNRLHNRFLFGEGVVCGLTVTCPPCGDGTVVVAPGYALDCCGNDIYVPCRQEVDINTLVRELRLRQLDGWDCGDPCKAKGCDDTDKLSDPDKPKPATYHYCLFIKYRESQIDPVAPYMSDAACGAIACEPSRICEGYTFELRCTKKPDPADIFDRIKGCIGDLRAAAAASQSAQVNSARAAELSQGAVLASASQIVLEDADLQAMDAATNRLKSANLSSTKSQARLDEAATRRHLADYQLLAVGVARANQFSRMENASQFGQAVESARAVLGEATVPLRNAAPKLIMEPTARAASRELFELTERYALLPSQSGLDSTEARMFRAGAPVSAKQLSQMRVDAAQLKMFLQERLERSTALTSCELLDRLHAIRIDEDEVSIAGVSGAARAIDELALILLEYLRDCLCLALNPVCAPCDDPAVLLACLDVRDCEVIDVCNMSRRFVLSPAALRYWFPPITGFGKLLEWFCCELEFKRQRVEGPINTGRPPTLSAERSFFRTSAAPTLDTATLDPELKMAANTLGLRLADVEQATLLAAHLGVLGISKVPMVTNLGRAVRGGLNARVVLWPAESDIGALRPELTRDVVAATFAAERDATLEVARNEANKLVEERLATIRPVNVGRAVKDEVKAALSDDALDKRLSAAKAMKDITADNRNLRAEIKRLSDAVKKLQG